VATFNGYTIVVPPAFPSAPASIEWEATDIAAASTSVFTGQQQIQDWQNAYLKASVTMSAMTNVTAQAWIGFLLGLRGIVNIFQLGDPLTLAPLGTGYNPGSFPATPEVQGSNQTGFALQTKGWNFNGTGVLLSGDWFQVGYRLYRATANVNANSSGDALIPCWPNIRESPPDGTAINLTATQGIWRLDSGVRKWSENSNRFYGIQFNIREAI
jgi:hypothetical protein